MADPTLPLPALRIPAWESIPNLVHGFLGRPGGVSRGAFAELNLSDRVGDAADAVRENWRRVTAAMGGLRAARMQQVHGSRVVVMNDANTEVGEADALLTCSAETALGVLTADCVPILMVAPQQHVVAAVHAGWRGTLAGVVQEAVRRIEREGGVQAAEIQVALGPAIDGCCYEVDASIADALEQRWGPMPDAVRRNRGPKAMIDLRLANTAILARSAVQLRHVVSVGPCTRCAAAEYFSHRSSGGLTGRQWSFIGWRSRPTKSRLERCRRFGTLNRGRLEP